jgi:hypothetical protein
MRLVALTVVTVLTLSGCGGDDGSSRTKVDNPLPTVSSGTPEASDSASQPKTSPTEEAALQLGDSVQAKAGRKITYTVSALKYRDDLKSGNPYIKPKKGQQFSALLAQFCLDENLTNRDAQVSTTPWTLRFPDGTLAEATSIGDEAGISPMYPDYQSVPVSTCVKGWIPFEVPVGQQPSLVVYSPGQGRSIVFEMRGS